MSKTKILSTALIIFGIAKVIVEAGESIINHLDKSAKSDEPDTTDDTVIEFNYAGEIEM